MPAHVIKKPIVLIAMGSYWPGAGANGPIKSLANLIEALSDTIDFRVVARDRPFGVAMPDRAVKTWAWHQGAHGVPVLHVPVEDLGLAACRRLLADTPHDAVYLNGFFGREFSIPMLAARRLQSKSLRKPTIIAPRGEFARDLLARKSLQKSVYMRAARHSGLLRDVWFHATADHEAADISAQFPGLDRILIASNIASLAPTAVARPDKQPGHCRLVFSGRIARKNNLDAALDILACVKASVTFDICGPVEDVALWKLCQSKIAALPSNITVHAHGGLSQSDLRHRLLAADGMLQPTRGDNFGHAIVEAMQAGLPVIISDRTPWTGLDREGAGWSLPLEPLEPYVAAVEALAGMDQAAWQRASNCARAYSDRMIRRPTAIDAHRAMFWRALGRSSELPLKHNLNG